MPALLDMLLTFPTVGFAALFVLVLLYWLLVLLGAADLDALDALDGLDGVFDGLDGAAEGLDAALDGVAEAGAEAASEAAAEGFAEGPLAATLLPLASVLRLGRVPLTFSLSAFVFAGFGISFALTWLWAHYPAAMPYGAFVAASSVASLVCAGVVTNVAVRPFEGMFVVHRARERRSLIGEVCEITTGRVDDGFGQATAHLGNDDLLFQVRCDSPNRMRRGDTALIVSFDDRREAYVVEPMADVREAVPTKQANGAPAGAPALANKEL